MEFNYGAPMEEYGKGRGSETKSFRRMVYGSGSARKFVPSDLPNLAAWFAFTRGITSAAGLVSQWDDQSGLGRHLKQATGPNKPALQGDGSILFDGVASFMQCTAFTLNQPETLYILGRHVTWGGAGQAHWCDGNTNNTMTIWDEGSTPAIDAFAGTRIGNNTNSPVNTYSVIAAVFNGVSSSLKVNNTTPTTGDCGASNAAGFTLGSSGAVAAFANIQIKEVIIYAAAHDANQRQTIINYLASVGQVSI